MIVFRNYLILDRVQEALHTSKNLLSFWRKVSNVGTDFMSDASMNCDDQNSHYVNNSIFGGNSTSTPINSGETLSASNTLKTPKQFSNIVNSTGTIQKLSKDAFVPVTPLFTASLGISTSSHISLATCLDVTGKEKINLYLKILFFFVLETASVIGQNATTTNLSEYGGTISTVSDSMGFISSSSKSYIRFPFFQIQVNYTI